MIGNTVAAKLKQLPDPLLQEVNDFIDFVIHKHQLKIVDSPTDEILAEKWSHWFDGVERLEATPPKLANHYQQLLLDKYRNQGLDL
jgi:hypothetical protein